MVVTWAGVAMGRARGAQRCTAAPTVRWVTTLALLLACAAIAQCRDTALAHARLRAVVRSLPQDAGPPPPPDTTCVTEDALVAMYNGLGGSSWFNHTGWAGAASGLRVSSAADRSPACDWFGIDCDENGAVTAVRLSGNGLSGPLTPQMLCLGPGVQGLDLSSNALTGTLPSPVSTKALLGLGELNLARNSLAGPVPTWYVCVW